MIQAKSALCDGTAESREKAVALYESVVQADPHMFEAHLQLIRLATEQGDLANASQLASRAIGANPENNDLMLVSAGVEAESGNYSRAMEQVNAVLQRNNSNISAKNLMVDMALRLNRLDEAEKQNKEVLARDSNQEGARLSQARILELRKKVPEAISSLEDFRRNPAGKDSYRVALALADLYRQQKEFDKSEAMLKEVDVAVPDFYPAFTIRLQSLAAQRKFAELRDMVNQRLEARPNESQTLKAAAAILGDGGAVAELASLKPRYQSFVSANPSNVPGHLALARLCYSTDDLDGAQKSYEAALKIDPYNATALNDLAWILCENMGKHAEALVYANKGVLRYEGDANLRNTRAVIFYRMKDPLKARLDLQKCIDLPTVMPSTKAKSLALLARIETTEGDPKQARALAEQAKQIDREVGVLSPQERTDLDKVLGAPATRASTQ
jgi:tetratricopeptide (TPR) repeat protein